MAQQERSEKGESIDDELMTRVTMSVLGARQIIP
eukprot:CAMPEP_0185197908 /NCGR_PEP_ID=MMETSP1140-20130426/41599_1 /TAXON_ID=298111 /ORGANISM="Pavlova sp., Strain CCMP459" /LENGTH=33 /DNA_ID= /DNA_START= /DNA_END= /DNA_ORIENTATION=